MTQKLGPIQRAFFFQQTGEEPESEEELKDYFKKLLSPHHGDPNDLEEYQEHVRFCSRLHAHASYELSLH